MWNCQLVDVGRVQNIQVSQTVLGSANLPFGSFGCTGQNEIPQYRWPTYSAEIDELSVLFFSEARKNASVWPMHLSHSRCLGGAWRRISRPIGLSSLPFCSLPSWECVESNSVWWVKSAKFHFIQFCLCFRLMFFWGGLLFQFCSPGSQVEFVESDRTSGGWCQTFWKITTSSRDGWRTSATVTFVPRCAKPGTGFSVHTEFQSAREMGGRHEWGAEKGSVQIFFVTF